MAPASGLFSVKYLVSKRFVTPAEVEQLIREFETQTLPRSQWTHQAHLTVALWYLVNYSFADATECIRTGIQRYNAAMGIETTPTGGYHETLTWFWIHIVQQFVQKNGVSQFTVEAVEQLSQAYTDPNLPFQYYSRDRLLSWAARSGWLDPDLQPLDHVEPLV